MQGRAYTHTTGVTLKVTFSCCLNESMFGKLPKNGSDPHDVAVVQDVIGQQSQRRVTLVTNTGIHNTTRQQCP